MIRKLRFFLTRVFFFALGLRIDSSRSQVSFLWSLDYIERNRTLERILQTNSPVNADGVLVTSLAGIESSPLMSKGRYRELNRGTESSGAFQRKTSGTTGEPTKVTLSRVELSRMLGVRDYCFRQYGVRVGDREARFWGRPEFGLRNNLKNFALNRKVCCPSGDRAKESLVKILKWGPDYLYGYASLLLEAATMVERDSIQFGPLKCVICTAETILPAQKEYLAKVFNAPVVEEYGATEFDIVAFECRGGHRHFVNPWLIIKESDESLLITDVSRKSASLVNYELGDSGSIEIADCSILGSSAYLKVLTGRSINRFVYIDSETKFHSVDLSYAINEFQTKARKIFSFRMVQNEYGIVNVYISNDLQRGNEELKYYMERFIRRKAGIDIVVNVFANKKPTGFSSKSYFIQNISASEENVTQQ